jgi:LPS sulfotransferase NodH
MVAWIPARGYLICCIERTGSNLLAEALRKTERAGRPLEYFSPVLQDTPWMRGILGDATMLSGFANILRAGSTSNGVFGAKLHWVHVRYLARALSSPDGELPAVEPGGYQKLLAQLPQLLPTAEFLQLLRVRVGDRSRFTAVYKLFEAQVPELRVIWLRRENMVARAISHYRALHSKVWSRPKSSADAAAEVVPEFDPARIHQLYGLGIFQEESWQCLFGELGVTPHCLTYEELAADYEPTVRGVLKFLGLEEPVGSIGAPNLARQADAVSQEWELRYRELSADAGA